MKELRTGSLAYLDSFAGLVPVKVLGISGVSGLPSTAQRVTVQVTGRKHVSKGYAFGETLETTGLHVCPRTSVHVRCGQYRIRTDYTVVVRPSSPLVPVFELNQRYPVPDVDFQQRYGNVEQPDVARFLGYESKEEK